jgi:hypothetical protein
MIIINGGSTTKEVNFFPFYCKPILLNIKVGVLPWNGVPFAVTAAGEVKRLKEWLSHACIL